MSRLQKIYRYPLRSLEGVLDRVLAVAGAVTAAQFPQFYAQYLQRLAGHLDEARRTVALYSSAAASLHLTLNQYITAHLLAHHPIFVSSGNIMQALVLRLHELESAYDALVKAPPFWKGWIFLLRLDPELARQTGALFVPGIPTTWEGFAYALLGVLATFALYRGVKALLCWTFLSPPRRPSI